jgi:hypothetical protein
MDEETNLEPQEPSETEDILLLFVKTTLPATLATRIMRRHIIDEILAALLRVGILTKEQLADALEQGENSVLEACQELKEPYEGTVHAVSIETAEKMAQTAARVSKRLRDKFINN